MAVGVIFALLIVIGAAVAVFLYVRRKKQRELAAANGTKGSDVANVELNNYSPIATPAGSKDTLGTGGRGDE